jgi:four helix bundle protein
MTYEEWEQAVPAAITGDALWKMRVYRLALFVGDLGWHDVVKLAQDRRAVSLADQLYRALGSISANIAEGYSRGSGKDQARMHEYALGSAREARDWYWKSRHVLGEDVTSHRIDLLTQIIRLLLVIVPSERAHHVREEPSDYTPALAA